ncbi:MAG TPA: SurA N-terminal domain-containing protein [Beijerinckiaceae bacterium]|nr:SurA N-terminal domain-containing protein [Beijerinckiaceae bacterium]
MNNALRAARMTVALLATALLLAVAGPARAQSVAAFVNGEPITTYDLEQRMKINGAMGRRGLSRQQTLQELVDDKLKIIEARRIGYRLSDDNVEEQVTRIARQNRQSTLEFMQNLAKVGIDSNAYRAKLRADYSWELATSHKFRTSGAASGSEVDSIFQSKVRDGGAKVTDYVLQSVVFVVGTGVSPATREREANGARSRFDGCENGIEPLRQMRDVAIKSPVKRSSNTLSPQLAAVLAKTPSGKMTPPFRSDQGIELIAVCEKTERVDTAAARSQAEEEVAAKKRVSETDTYLKSLRSKAVIQYR